MIFVKSNEQHSDNVIINILKKNLKLDDKFDKKLKIILSKSIIILGK